jgi:hypothetical protein
MGASMPEALPFFNSARGAIEGQFAATARCRLPERQDANDCCAVQNRQDISDLPLHRAPARKRSYPRWEV